MARDKKIISIEAPVTINAAEGDDAGPATFDVLAYTGGALTLAFWDKPVVIDLAGLKFSRSVVANLDHNSSQRVGHVTEKAKADGKLQLAGVFSAATAYRDEVVLSAKQGFTWEASIEVSPIKLVEVDAGKVVTVNGQEFTGPLYVTRTGTLSGFAFVSHGADAGTDVRIAAVSANHKGSKMKDEVKAWVASVLPSVNIDELTVEEVANLEADYEGRQTDRIKIKGKGLDPIESRATEAKRRATIMQLAEKACDNALAAGCYDNVAAIRECRDRAIKGTMSVSDFRYEMRIAEVENIPPEPRGGPVGLNARVLEAAICAAGNLPNLDKQYDDQTLQLARDQFKGRISLNEALIVAAEYNGYTGRVGNRVDTELHNWAFGYGNSQGRQQRGAAFSTISLPNTFANVANKFMRAGWDAVDQTPLRIAAIRSVSDFKQITTVSLTGAMQFLPVGPDGEIKHGELGEEVYTNQVATAGIMFAITRVDYRNDDLSSLTSVPRKMGRGGMLYLNHIFWTEFLNPSVVNFWHANNANVNTGVADMTIGGLSATETIFMSQTDHDGKPLLAQAAMLVVPTAIKAAALTLMSSEKLIDGTGTTIQGDNNIWRGRFRVESSPYMSNAAYTGYSASAWYMLADPSDIPVIEIAALDGNVMPTVETADTAFNTLGVQMRGYSDVGVKAQEPKGGVRADGGSS